MNWLRVIMCIIFPPLAVIDKGIKPVLLTCLLTFLGWVPGIICALVYSSRPKQTASFPA